MKTQRFVVVFTLVNSGLLFASLFFFIAQSQPTVAKSVAPTLRARTLELVDEKSQVRAQFNVEATGEVVLRLRDEAGAIRVKLGASEQGSGLLLLNDATEPGVQMLTNSTGTTLTLTANGQTMQKWHICSRPAH